MAPRLLHYSDIENAYDDPERIGRLAGCIEARRDASTIVFGTGDNTGPGVLSLIEEGAQALDFFDAVHPDAETFGNHDFDHGPDRTRELVAASPQPWVSANVRNEDGERFGATDGVTPWTVAHTKEASVGIIGVITPDTADISTGVDDLFFTNPVAAIREHLPVLRERTEYVVVLAHTSETEELATIPGVDAVLSGHTHDREVEQVDGTVVVRTGVNGSHVAEVQLGDEPDVTFLPVAAAPVDERVTTALETRISDSGLDEVVATVETPIARTEAATFCGESRLGNFVTDAYRWAGDADVGLCSAGEHRTGDPLEGELRAIDLVSIAPFDERVAVAELSGACLRETLEQLRLCEQYPEAPPDHIGHVSGAHLTWRDGTLVSVEVNGAPLDRNRTYTIAASSHLFVTDHLFSAFDDEDRIQDCGKRHEALVTYAREQGIDPVLEDRIRRK